MGDFQDSKSATKADTKGEEQASLVVGKIKPGEGLWGALEQIAGTDAVRNGVLVVFSQEASGRLGVFSNRSITGGVVDASSDTGIKAIKSLLAVKQGMFCFRPCLADETSELGQKISISIKEVLALRHDEEPAEIPADTLTRIKLRQVQDAVNGTFLSDVAEAPVEAAVVDTGVHKLSEIEASLDEPEKAKDEAAAKSEDKPSKAQAQSKSKEQSKATEEPAADKPPPLPTAPPPRPPQAAEDKPAKVDKPKDGDSPAASGTLDYLGWVENQNRDKSSHTLQKILLPATRSRSEKPGQKEQVALDLEAYRSAIQHEEDKVRKDIEKTLERAASDPVAKQTLQDMELLAGMLHQQGEMLQHQKEEMQQRWKGLDDIPTPRAKQDPGRNRHMDPSGEFKVGAPVRTTNEFLTGCEDLVTSSVRIVDAKKFIETGTATEDVREHPWLNRRTMVALGILLVVAGLISFISSQLNSVAVANCLREGREHLRAERWKSALLVFNDAVAKDPGNARAYFYRGIAQEEMGLEKEAQADFQTAQNSGIPAADIATAQAGSAVRREEWQTAINICAHAISDGLKTPEMYRLRANAYMHIGAYKEAKDDCDNALGVSNDDEQKRQILADRGFAKIQLKDFEGGAQDFDAILKDHPDTAILMLKGDAYRKVTRYNDAMQNYNTVIELDPKNYNAYVARGMCEAALHQQSAALKDFGRALNIDPNGVEALIQRGSLQLSLGAYRLAMTDLQTAWDLNPTVEETHQKLMMAYARAKKDMPKQLVLKKDSKLPSDPKQLVYIGYNDMTQGDLDGAIDALGAAVKKEPNNTDARRYLAHAFAKTGDFDSANSQFKALTSMQCLSEDDALIYADSLEKYGDCAQAVQVLNHCLSANENSSPMRVKLAQIYYRLGQQKDGDKIAETGLSRAKSFEDRQKFLDLINTGANQRQFKGGPADLPTNSHG